MPKNWKEEGFQRKQRGKGVICRGRCLRLGPPGTAQGFPQEREGGEHAGLQGPSEAWSREPGRPRFSTLTYIWIISELVIMPIPKPHPKADWVG